MNTENLEKMNIENEVLRKIKLGEIKMRSKAYFVVKIALLVSLMFATFVFSILLISYVLFSLKAGGNLFLLSFGAKGVFKFVLLLPWFLLLINIFLIAILDYFLRRFKFGYNRPLIYLFLITLTSVTLLSFLFNLTSFHNRVLSRAERDKLPIIGKDFYGSIRNSAQDEGIYRGKVIEIGENYVVIKKSPFDFQAKFDELKVYLPAGVSLSGFLKVGDDVFLASDMATGTQISAYGVHKIPAR